VIESKCLYISQAIDIENHRHFCSLHHLLHLRWSTTPGANGI
jgi:hypothetical protein